MTSPHPTLTPRQAYHEARAKEQAAHKYTTEGVHAVCSCGTVSTTEAIGQHIEELAEAAGVGARDNAIRKAAAEYDAIERRKKADADRRMEEARLVVEKEDRERFR